MQWYIAKPGQVLDSYSAALFNLLKLTDQYIYRHFEH